jgi:hypothetical protein
MVSKLRKREKEKGVFRYFVTIGLEHGLDGSDVGSLSNCFGVDDGYCGWICGRQSGGEPVGGF